MARIGTQHDGIAALRVIFKNGLPFFGNADWPTPMMIEVDTAQRGMETVNTFLQEREQIFGLALRDVNVGEFAPITRKDQAAAEDNAVAERPAPQIR